MAHMTKTVEYRCIHCIGADGKFKTQEEAEKHMKAKHGENNGT